MKSPTESSPVPYRTEYGWPINVFTDELVSSTLQIILQSNNNVFRLLLSQLKSPSWKSDIIHLVRSPIPPMAVLGVYDSEDITVSGERETSGNRKIIKLLLVWWQNNCYNGVLSLYGRLASRRDQWFRGAWPILSIDIQIHEDTVYLLQCAPTPSAIFYMLCEEK